MVVARILILVNERLGAVARIQIERILLLYFERSVLYEISPLYS